MARNKSKEINLAPSGNLNPRGIWADDSIMYVTNEVSNKVYAYVLGKGIYHSAQDISLDSSNDDPTGIWGNSTTIWVADKGTTKKLYAYHIHDSFTRVPSKDVALNAINNRPAGFYSDGTTVWVGDWKKAMIYAYTLSTGARDSSKDILNSRFYQATAGDIWIDGTTLYCAGTYYDKGDFKYHIFAYNLTTKKRDVDKEISPSNENKRMESIWSNSSTMWVLDTLNQKLYAYTLSTGSRDADKDITLHADNALPGGIYSNGTTMFVSDFQDGKIYAYVLTSGVRDASKDMNSGDLIHPHEIWANLPNIWVCDYSDDALEAWAVPIIKGGRDSNKDITLDSANNDPAGIWSNGTTIWVVQKNSKLYAYTLSTGTRDTTNEIDLDSNNDNAFGITGDGTTIWVSDRTDKKAYAYTISTRSRDASKDISFDTDNANLYGIWSDGTTMYVADRIDNLIYAYD